MSKSSLSQSPPAPQGYELVPFKQAPVPKHIGKSLYLLDTTITNLFRHHPVTRVAFATLTFPEPVRNPKAAHRCLNSFLNVLRKRGMEFIWVLEPHQKEGLHYHLLVALPFDCHEGTQVECWADKSIHNDDLKRQLMSPELRAEYDWWTTTTPRYGFGRIDLAPIHSNAEAIRKYLTKMEWRYDHWVFDEATRLRFWSCSRSLKSGTVEFSWNTPGGKAGRARMQAWAAECGCDSREAVRTLLGPRWGYRYRCETSVFSAPSDPAPRVYVMVPAAHVQENMGEAVSAETAKQVENRQAGSPPAEGFECLGRRRRQATDTEKSRTDARACRVRTVPNPITIPPPVQWRRGPTDVAKPLSLQHPRTSKPEKLTQS